jgi:hypothetical protein
MIHNWPQAAVAIALIIAFTITALAAIGRSREGQKNR